MALIIFLIFGFHGKFQILSYLRIIFQLLELVSHTVCISCSITFHTITNMSFALGHQDPTLWNFLGRWAGYSVASPIATEYEEQCQSLDSSGNEGIVLPPPHLQKQRVSRKMKPWLKIAINLWNHEFCLNKIIASYSIQCFMPNKAISHHNNCF